MQNGPSAWRPPEVSGIRQPPLEWIELVRAADGETQGYRRRVSGDQRQIGLSVPEITPWPPPCEVEFPPCAGVLQARTLEGDRERFVDRCARRTHATHRFAF